MLHCTMYGKAGCKANLQGINWGGGERGFGRGGGGGGGVRQEGRRKGNGVSVHVRGAWALARPSC